MSVYQVEEYYLYIKGIVINETTKAKITAHLESEGYYNYEFQGDDTSLVVNDVDSGWSGELLDAELNSIISGNH